MAVPYDRQGAFARLQGTLIRWNVDEKRAFEIVKELEDQDHITSRGVDLLCELFERAMQNRNQQAAGAIQQLNEWLKPAPPMRPNHSQPGDK